MENQNAQASSVVACVSEHNLPYWDVSQRIKCQSQKKKTDIVIYNILKSLV